MAIDKLTLYVYFLWDIYGNYNEIEYALKKQKYTENNESVFKKLGGIYEHY